MGGCASKLSLDNDTISDISQHINAKNIEKASVMLLKLGEAYESYNRDGKVRIDGLIGALLQISAESENKVQG
mgnify:CR=1 FL=1